MANTTSGTTTFDKTFSIEEIIEDAFERIGLNSVAGYQLKSARRSLNILFQEWGNRGIHYWEIGDTNLDLIEGQSDYDFFRSSDDGTSATTTAPASVFGISDVLEAQLRSNRTQTTQSDSPMTKVDRSTMQVSQINFHKEHLINIGFKDLLIMLVLVFIQLQIQLMHLKICIFII